MYIKYFFLLIVILLCSCGTQSNNGAMVSFSIEGRLKDLKKLSQEFGANQMFGDGILEIKNNLDSTIYVPTDSNYTFIPPVYYSYPKAITGKEVLGNIESILLPYRFVKIDPKTSKRFITTIPFLPFDEFKRYELTLQYAYTTNYKGIADSDWKLVSQKFSFDVSYTLKPIK